MQDYNDKVAIITGGASGIGLGLAQRFAGEGARLMLADIEADALTAAANELRAAGATVSTMVCDVSAAQQVETLADYTYETFGAAHILCNNAGVVTQHPAWGPLDDWEWVLGVDLFGVIHGVRSFVPRMLDAGEEGHILNTASTAGLLAVPNIAAYNVAKRGVVALSETMYHELAKSPLGVSVLCPGLVDTQIYRSERNRPGIDTAPPNSLGDLHAAEALSPAQVADIVVEAIDAGVFWILPHAHYGDQAVEQAQRMVSGGKPVLPRIDR